mmetsp:Transcript_61591/g.121883  ORF Transcript_61591/g.121883 Transcript_61591/m.121883 type:complete len:289 (+) Transcript_61591:86-952(+)
MAFPITLKPLRGQIFKVTSEPGETIRDLKGKVAEHGSEFPEALQQLIYRGKILKDTDVVLDLGIKPDQFIVVMLIKTKPKQKLVANASATVQTPINCPTVPAVVPTATESEAVTVAAPSVAPPVAPPIPPPVAPLVAPMVAPPDLQVARRVQPFPSTDVIIANATIETVAEPPVSLLADLRLSPQFAAMARMLLQEPQQALRYMLPRLVRGNLDLARAIQDNLPAFLQLLQEVGSRPRLSDGNWDELLASNPELLEEMLPEIEAQDFEMAEAIRSDPAAFLAAFQRPR